jgi:hypothetical protein
MTAISITRFELATHTFIGINLGPEGDAVRLKAFVGKHLSQRRVGLAVPPIGLFALKISAVCAAWFHKLDHLRGTNFHG